MQSIIKHTHIYDDSKSIYMIQIIVDMEQARQTRPNSGGVAEGHPRFDKGALQYFFTFYALKI